MVRLLLMCFLLTSAFVPLARGEESAAVSTRRTVATLITEADSVAAGGKVRIALRLRLADGWHTYWKNPGEAGVPVELAVDLANGAVAGPIEWPTPVRISEGSITTYGFTGEVILPVTITMGPHGDAVTGQVQANWLVCKDICVPEEASFPIRIPKGTGAMAAQGKLFEAHDAAVPRASIWTASVAPDGVLSVRGARADMVVDAWFIPDAPDQIIDHAPQSLSAAEGGFSLGLRPGKGFAAAAGLQGILSVRDRGGARVDMVLTAGSGPMAAPALPLVNSLVFAFLGGLILNLMPCVFPILAMKAVGFAEGMARGTARAHAIAYTVGVVATFLGLATVLLVSRAAGSAAGWGFQFASPIFVTMMSWLLFAVGLNLSGVFQIGGGFLGVGGNLAAKGGRWGSFFTGTLAVLVATPCTAPFMGAAIAAGLAATPSVTILIFGTMGLGLAAPYLVLSAFPRLSQLLPRPGAWMEIFRQFLAFPMYGAAVWLLWVVSQQAGAQGVLAAATGFLLIGFAAWILGITRDRTRKFRALGLAGGGMAIVLAAAQLPGLGLVSEPNETAVRDSEAFTPARLASLRAEGRPVFVNLTAAWCVTCLVNERVAIGRESVRRGFAEHGVVYLKGDWTRQDPAITAFLRDLGRDGVPLYLYYGPKSVKPRILPQLLTEAMVLEAIGTRL